MRGPARDGALVPVLGRRVSDRGGRPREDILRPLGRVGPRAGVELRRGGRRARARAGVARGWARVPRTRARVRRRAGGRERHRARARRRSRGSLLLFLRAGGSASDAGGKKVPGMRRGRATRRRGNGGGGTRDARRTLVAGSLGAGSRAACRAGAYPPATALCVVRKRRGFSARKKEEGRRSVGGFRMTRFAGLSTREKGRGRTLVFGDAVAFLETPPMVAFDAAFALAAAPPRRRCDVKEADSSPPALPRRESFGEDEPSTRSGSFVFPRKCKDDVPKNTRDALLLLAHLRVSTVVGADTSACAGRPPSAFQRTFSRNKRAFSNPSTFPKI